MCGLDGQYRHTLRLCLRVRVTVHRHYTPRSAALMGT
jgi:hypothetical protein